MNKPRILFYDLETFPNTGYFWAGKTCEINIIEVIKYGGLASVAWSWDGEETVYCLTRKGYKNDKHLVKKLISLFNEADIIVAHNGISFDNKTSNTNILKHDLIPPAPVKTIDTKVVAKKHFRFDSNSLDALAAFLSVGRKLKHKGFDMWKECLEQDLSSAWKDMAKYNKHDVVILKGVYYKLLPWISNTINASTIAERPEMCPKPGCGGTNLQARGFTTTASNKYRRFQCQKCGGWCKGRTAVKTAKTEYK
jgi:hypothetical protein